MHLFYTTLLLIISYTGFAQVANTANIDPDLIDAEMTRVMYNIAPGDLKTSVYKNGYPSAFNLKLCQACKIKTYTLEQGAELLLNEQALELKNLTTTLIKKKFDVIQLGIDRTNKTVTYLYLGGISELSAEDLGQEQSDEY